MTDRSFWFGVATGSVIQSLAIGIAAASAYAAGVEKLNLSVGSLALGSLPLVLFCIYVAVRK